MMNNAQDRNKRFSGDARLVPPDKYADALLEAEVEVREVARLNDQQTTHIFLRAWAGVIEEIGHYEPYSSHEYEHRIGFRMVLHRMLVALCDLGHTEELDWLQREVDRLDQIFLERSSYDTESLILLKAKTSPSYWFLRRLPNDKNVIDHLRMIQPTTAAANESDTNQ